MRDFDQKADNTAPLASGRLPALQFNTIARELEQFVSTTGITLDPATGSDTDTKMLAQAAARYASGGITYQDQGAANAAVLSGIAGADGFVVPKAYFHGMIVRFHAASSNSGPVTVNFNGLGTKVMLSHTGAALEGGEIIAQRLIDAQYDSSANGGVGAFKLAPWANALLYAGGDTNIIVSGGIPYAVDAGTADAIVTTFSPTITSISAGQIIEVKVANTNTGAATLKVDAFPAVAIRKPDLSPLVAGDLIAGGLYLFSYDGTYWQVSGQSKLVPNVNAWAGIPLEYVSGTSIKVLAGSTWADDAATVITAASDITLNLATTGAAALDTGSLANTTWYHVFLIRNVSTGAVSAVASLSATSPTMPSGYTKKRYVGSVRTNGSSAVLPFDQFGDYVRFRTKISSRAWVPPSNATVILAVPTGRRVLAHIGVGVLAAYQGITAVRVQSTDMASPGGSGYDPLEPVNQGFCVSGVGYGGGANYGEAYIPTNTSAQVVTFEYAGYGGVGVPDPRGGIATIGWKYI